MTRVMIDDKLFQRLGGLPGPFELCDEDGNTLGYFTPAGKSDSLDLGLSEEEIERRQQVRTGRTLDAIVADLENRK